MKRSGFTMIELVFVIVILGILASVAIPKLAATRDDANIAKSTSEVSSMIQDIGSHYTAKGNLEKNVSTMTNVPLFTKTDGSAQDNVSYDNGATPTVYYIDTKRKVACLDVVLNDVNGTVTLSQDDAGVAASIFCKGLVSALNGNKMLKTYSFGGSSIY